MLIRPFFRQTIFILAPPRSGSTFLFECLAQFRELHCLFSESDIYWWKVFPYSRNNRWDDYVGTEELTKSNKIKLRRLIYDAAVRSHAKRHDGNIDFFKRKKVYPIRYLDKTIANCFHLDVLNRIFPNSKFIFLVRDPRANISSMIEGWKFLNKFGKPDLTEIIENIDDATIEHWCYPAPPGWEKMVDKPLSEICAWSWEQHVQYTLDFFDKQHFSFFKLSYERLRDETLSVIEQLAEYLNLELTEQIEKYIIKSPQSRTTISEPEIEKWKKKNPEAIESIIPKIQNTAQKIGYEI